MFKFLMKQNLQTMNISEVDNYDVVRFAKLAYYGQVFWLLLFCFWGVSTQAEEKPLFDGDFSSLENLSKQFYLKKDNINENIRIVDGKLEINALKSATEGIVSISINPKLKLPKEFSIEVQFTILDKKGDNFLRCGIGNIAILNRDTITRYVGANGREIEFPIKINSMKKNCELVMSITPKGVAVFREGILLGTIPGKITSDKIYFTVYNQHVRFDKISLFSGNAAKGFSPNLLPNSSFEVVNNKMPDYWGLPHWGVLSKRLINNMADFHSRFKLQSGDAFDGNNSFMIKPLEPLEWAMQLTHCWVPLEVGKDYVWSAYIKADTDNAQFRVGENTGSVKQCKNFSVSTKWKRYSYTFNAKEANARIFFRPITPNVCYYIDAVQLEKGTLPTPYRSKSYETTNKEYIRPVFNIGETSQSPIIDGSLDDVAWKSAAKYAMKNSNKPKDTIGDPTNVYLMKDSENIYIGVECFTEDMNKLKADVTQYKGPVWNDDDVEFLFKPDANGNSYIQFAVNTIGTKYEGKTLADISWTGEWDCKVKKFNDKFIVEAKIPFAVLELRNQAKELIFNVVRNNIVQKELSALAPTYGSFLNQQYWGIIDFPGDIGGISLHKLDLGYSGINSNEKRLIAEIFNSSASAVNISTAVEIISDTRKINRTGNVTIPSGKSGNITFDQINIPGEKNIQIQFKGFDSKGNCVIAKNTVWESLKKLELIPEYNYFSSENKFRFKLINNSDDFSPISAKWTIRQNTCEIESGEFNLSSTKDTIFDIFSELMPGKYQLEVSCASNIISTPFIVLKTIPNERKVNKFRQTIVIQPGKEFFVWGLYVETQVGPEMKLYADAGFNVVRSFVPAENGLAEVQKMLELADVNNLLLSLYITEDKSIPVITSEMAKIVNQVGQSSALLMYDTLDEAMSQWSPMKSVAAYNKLKSQVDPHLLFFQNDNLYGIMRKQDFSPVELVCLDRYAIPDGDIGSISLILQSMKDQNPHKSYMFIAQSAGNAYSYGREPTVEEYYNQCYQAFAKEVFNIMFFANHPLSQEAFPALKMIRDERDAILYSGYLDGTLLPVVSSDKRISVVARQIGDIVMVIAVNTTREAVKTSFISKDNTTEDINVMFEDRVVRMKDAVWSDNFMPLERHVYHFRLNKVVSEP